ncbi:MULTISPECIES: CE1759 family FMN reductase [unclassified Streptomyces]|uniref:CE1759 family FMN reductase n=1 Tax=unclassified Streptomyces TaxID=2593676 RepID=UPI00081EA035|nr:MULTISPECIES: CE1759 family FMN reductase [unclassified Streptomyces]MYZ39750.1 oxidoreductase [Streptomyces sp. SID4917]SCG05109.1 FMN reductase [Streptomyces sp. MnatMP-M17]
MEALRLVAVSAGLGKPSSSRLLADRLAEATARELAAAGRKVEVEVVELRELAVDIANNLVTGFPSTVLSAALDRVTGADGLIVVTPVFAASYSGLFKSFFDLVEPDALTGTPVLLAATGGTARHSLVLEHALRPLFTYLHALTSPTAVFAATDDWGAAADTHAGGLPARITHASTAFAHLLATVTPAQEEAPKPPKTHAAHAAAEDLDNLEDLYDDLDGTVPFEQLLRRLA